MLLLLLNYVQFFTQCAVLLFEPIYGYAYSVSNKKFYQTFTILEKTFVAGVSYVRARLSNAVCRVPSTVMIMHVAVDNTYSVISCMNLNSFQKKTEFCTELFPSQYAPYIFLVERASAVLPCAKLLSATNANDGEYF